MLWISRVNATEIFGWLILVEHSHLHGVDVGGAGRHGGDDDDRIASINWPIMPAESVAGPRVAMIFVFLIDAIRVVSALWSKPAQRIR